MPNLVKRNITMGNSKIVLKANRVLKTKFRKLEKLILA